MPRFRESLTLTGRPRKYIPRVVCNGDEAIATTIRAQMLKMNEPMSKVLKEFAQHCELNQMEPTTEDAQVTYVASMQAQGLAMSTVRSRFLLLMKGITRKTNAHHNDILKVINLQDAKTTHNHAEDRRLSELITTIQAVKDVAYRAGAWLVLATGIRFGDLAAMSTSQFFLDDDVHLSFDIHVAKNVRTHSDKKTVEIPWMWIPAMPNEVSDLLSKDECCPFTSLTTAKMNDQLKAIDSKIRTKSLRRAYIHNIVEHCRTDKGAVDWTQVSGYTGHSNLKTLKSSYQVRANARRQSAKRSKIKRRR